MSTNDKRTLAACGEPFPAGDRKCGKGGWCGRLPGHDGTHTTEGDGCNRPAGHYGDHLILGSDFSHLARWPVRDRRPIG